MRKAVIVAVITGLAGFGGAALAGAAEAATVHHPVPAHGGTAHAPGKTVRGHGKGKAHHSRPVKKAAPKKG